MTEDSGNNKELKKGTLKLGIKVDSSKIFGSKSSFSVEIRKSRAKQTMRNSGNKFSLRPGDSPLTQKEECSRMSAVKAAIINEQQKRAIKIEQQNQILKEKERELEEQKARELEAKLQGEKVETQEVLLDNATDKNNTNFVKNIKEDVKIKTEPVRNFTPAVSSVDSEVINQLKANKSVSKKNEGSHTLTKDKDKKTFTKNNKDFESDKNSKVNKFDKKLFAKKGANSLGYNDSDAEDDNSSKKRRFTSHRKGRTFNSKKVAKVIRSVVIHESMSIAVLATGMGESIKKISSFLYKEDLRKDRLSGESTLSTQESELVVDHFGHEIKKIIKNKFGINHEQESESDIKELRPPIVTVMGHVDHGKTSLLDAIRHSDVVSSEHGGITQSIGAYQIVDENGYKITFIDTPGHEAFSAMRMRGASVTDIVILVVAGDDGIKEQTIEAINHAKASEATMIVAVNKMDKQEADFEKVTRSLLQYDVTVEEFGGDVIAVPVSAKTGYNLDKLKETILLVAEMMELKAAYNCKASGVIIETSIDKGMGVLATVLIKKGILKIGDVVLVGNSSFGKIRVLIDSNGSNTKNASISEAVRIVGFTSVPIVGDIFSVVESEKFARGVISHAKDDEYIDVHQDDDSDELSLLLSKSNADNKKDFSIIIKADTIGSKEAICESLLNPKFLSSNADEIDIKIIHSAVGHVSMSDVMLASASSKNKAAIIFAFNLSTDAKIVAFAKQYNVEIYTHTIIYDLINQAKILINSILTPKIIENIVGSAEIRAVFSSNRKGSVVGCYVTNGYLKRGHSIKLIRNGEVLHSCVLKVLRRFTEDAKEVKTGLECGVFISGVFKPSEGDKVECFLQQIEESKLK